MRSELEKFTRSKACSTGSQGNEKVSPTVDAKSPSPLLASLPVSSLRPSQLELSPRSPSLQKRGGWSDVTTLLESS